MNDRTTSAIKAHYLQLATETAKAAGKAMNGYRKAIRNAVRTHGDVTGKPVPVIYGEHFPAATKARLQKLHAAHARLIAASKGDYAASGKRKPWGETELADFAYGLGIVEHPRV